MQGERCLSICGFGHLLEVLGQMPHRYWGMTAVWMKWNEWNESWHFFFWNSWMRGDVCLEKFSQILRQEDFQERWWWTLLRWLFTHQLNVLIQGLQGMKGAGSCLGCSDLSRASAPNSPFATYGYKWPNSGFFTPSRLDFLSLRRYENVTGCCLYIL